MFNKIYPQLHRSRKKRSKPMRMIIMIVCSIVILIVLQTMHHFLMYLRTNLTAKRSDERPKDHLIILSTWRSGSSLVGQFFSQHPDVFYLKEPSWHVWKTMYQNNAESLHMSVRDLIRSVLKCDMSVFDAYIENQEKLSDLFHWESSRALCSPPACTSFSRTDIVDETSCKKMCGQWPFQKVEDTCITYSHIVLQEYRIFDLSVLYSLLNDPSINLKILHVVRDPRAIAISREQVHRDLDFDNGIVLKKENSRNNDLKILQKICESQVKIYKTSKFAVLPLSQDRYKFLRYEDLVREPLKMARELYSFANLKMPKYLEPWIYNMTHGPAQKKRKAFIINPRNALKMARDWRTVVSLKKIKEVQTVCKEAMEIFNYFFVDSEDELRNLKVDVALPRGRDDFMWDIR
ncbi:carbohydrate sulfotransferase 5-like isoform 1-T1 [Anomaloglossus baeobatrachus]|uniref:carbohydrate sulfotransferase 5-like n=1 Tax=Anomaloglossus baeobatrachus TaxID=238106 RepID=UPI003F4FEE96